MLVHLLIIYCCSSPALCQNSPPHRGTRSCAGDSSWIDHHLELADKFAARGDYTLATDELERACILLGYKQRPSLHLRLASYYTRLEDYSAAREALGRGVSYLLDSSCRGAESDLCWRAKLINADNLLYSGAHAAAEAAYADLLTASAGVADTSAIALETQAWAQLRLGHALSRQGRYAEAQDTLLLAVKTPHRMVREHAHAANKLIAEHTMTPTYSPTLATLLSIVPGLGQAYTQHYAVAASTFIVNSILMYFTYDAWRKSREIPHYSPANAAGWGALSLTFYAANFASARSLAQEANSNSRFKFEAQLKPLGGEPNFNAFPW